MRHPALGPTARLAKRWLASHLLLPHFRDEAVDLLVAYACIHSGPYGPPQTHAAGFCRFLALLGSVSLTSSLFRFLWHRLGS